VGHGAGWVLLGDLGKLFFRLLVPEGMEQSDAALEGLLGRSLARNWERNFAKLFGGLVMMGVHVIIESQCRHGT